MSSSKSGRNTRNGEADNAGITKIVNQHITVQVGIFLG
ncbi:hypothetical protein D515_04544 [Grimontia indica]|uniref:Uncharacterized protein n=1 Tax=Grimontia indica TaxID=1056512 RepID=R1IP48_9GAMM|nr:hypothetical protein D515_04544 [Grimontia indica]